MSNRNQPTATNTLDRGNHPDPRRSGSSLASNHSANLRGEAQSALSASSQTRTPVNSPSNARSSSTSNAANTNLINPKVFSTLLYGSATKELELGSRGPEVIELKKMLNNVTKRGLFEKKLDITSDLYDEKTAADVLKFQKSHSLSSDLKVQDRAGLGQDGMAGRWTIAALLIKNGYQVPASRKDDLIKKLAKTPGEHLVETDTAKAPLKIVKPSHENKVALEIRTSTPITAPVKRDGFFDRTLSNKLSYLVNQKSDWDCGPGAAAAAVGIASGKNPRELQKQFICDQQSGPMSWNSPTQWGRSHGVSCSQLLNDNGAQTRDQKQHLVNHIKDLLSRGDKVVMISGGKPLAHGNGHLVTLVDVFQKGGKTYFVSIDPNGYNRPQRNVLSEDFLVRGDGKHDGVIKQAWRFDIPPHRVAELSGRSYQLFAKR